GGQQVAVDAVEPLDLAVLVGDKPRPVKPAGRNRPAETGRFLQRRPVLRRIHQQLLGDTADVDAGTAQVALLDHGNTRAESRRDPAGAHPARTRADRNQVVIVVRHRETSVETLTREAGEATPIWPRRWNDGACFQRRRWVLVQLFSD